MENASKALIIAGAILLAILIIALGVYIYQQASSNTGTEDLTSTAVQAHNDPFARYEGTISGTEYRALIDLIRNNNINYTDAEAQIELNGDSDPAALSTTKSGIDPNAQYQMTMDEYQTADGEYKGWVTAITVN